LAQENGKKFPQMVENQVFRHTAIGSETLAQNCAMLHVGKN
jgi:hypothetical protein